VYLALSVYVISTALMLTPALLAWNAGTFRLLHPAVFFPMLLAYQSGVPVLTYACTGDAMLRSSAIYMGDAGYYVYPLLMQLAACGVYYLGLWVSLGSVVPTREDREDLLVDMPTLARNSSHVFATGMLVLGLGTVMKLSQYEIFGGWTEAKSNPYEFIHATYGYYWLHVLYTSTFVIPAVMFLCAPLYGLVAFGTATVVASWLSVSKAVALRLVLPLVLFGLPRRLRSWRIMSVALVAGALLITPLFVAQYRGNQSDWFAENAFGSLAHREYSFEFFCLVSAADRFDEFPDTEGSYLVSAMLDLVPRVLWPSKPTSRNLELGTQWVPADYSHRVFVAPHLFGTLYLDGGPTGVLAGMGVLGLAFGGWYGSARRQTRRRQNRFPLILFLCNAVMTKGLVDGAISNYLMQVVFMTGLVAGWRTLAWSCSFRLPQKRIRPALPKWHARPARWTAGGSGTGAAHTAATDGRQRSGHPRWN